MEAGLKILLCGGVASLLAHPPDLQTSLPSQHGTSLVYGEANRSCTHMTHGARGGLLSAWVSPPPDWAPWVCPGKNSPHGIIATPGAGHGDGGEVNWGWSYGDLLTVANSFPGELSTAPGKQGRGKQRNQPVVERGPVRAGALSLVSPRNDGEI